MYVGKFTNSNPNMSEIVNRNLQSKMENETKNKPELDNSDKKSIRLTLNFKEKKDKALNPLQMLMERRENLQKQMESLSKKMEETNRVREGVLYEEKVTIVDGEEKVTKTLRKFSSLSDDEKEMLNALSEESSAHEKQMSELNKELISLNKDIETAIIQEKQKQLEKNSQKAKKEKDEIQQKNNKSLSEDEAEAEEGKRQMQFFTESDAVKKYTQQAKILKAQQNMKITNLEWRLATDRYNKAASEQRHEAFLNPDAGTTPDTSILQEKAKVSRGEFNSEESVISEEIFKAQRAMTGLDSSMGLRISKLTKKLEVINETHIDDKMNEELKTKELKEDEAELEEKANGDNQKENITDEGLYEERELN